MVKKIAVIAFALLGAWSCATVPTSAPAYFVEALPSDAATALRLDDRIAANDAWNALEAGRPEAARRSLLKMEASSPVREAGLAYADLLAGDLAAAEARFKVSLEAYPDMIPSRVGLAQIYEARREREKTFNEYREILKRDPAHRWAAPRFASLRDELVKGSMAAAREALASGNRETARRRFLEALFYAPDRADAHLELARLYRQEKNASAALLHFKSAMEERMEDEGLLREYADLLAEAGDLGQSLEILERLAAAEPKDEAVGKRVEELKAKLGVYELPSQYAGIPATETVTREELAALIGVKFGDFFDGGGRRSEILVDIATSWAQRFIVQVASLEIMRVAENHTFQPRRIINRAELADAAVRLIGVLQARGTKFVPLVEARRIQISDVSEDNFYYPAIARAVAYQVISLTPERRFEPERTVPGEEAVRVLDIIRDLAR
jgi:Tfp pilus assembly protein PilF